MTDIENAARDAAQRVANEIKFEFANTYGKLLQEHDTLIKSTDRDNPGILKQIGELRDDMRDSRNTQRWIIGLLFTILAVVVVCVVLLVMLWIQISVLAVKIG